MKAGRFSTALQLGKGVIRGVSPQKGPDFHVSTQTLLFLSTDAAKVAAIQIKTPRRKDAKARNAEYGEVNR